MTVPSTPGIHAGGADDDVELCCVSERLSGTVCQSTQTACIHAAEFARDVMGNGRTVEWQNQGNIPAGQGVEPTPDAPYRLLMMKYRMTRQIASQMAGNKPREHIIPPARPRTRNYGSVGVFWKNAASDWAFADSGCGLTTSQAMPQANRLPASKVPHKGSRQQEGEFDPR